MNDNIPADPFSAIPPDGDYLSHSAWKGSLDALRTWVRAEKINGYSGGRTPVQWAISGGSKEAMNFLAERSGDIYKKTEEGDNALACAVWSRKAWLVQDMLALGFDPLEKNIHGVSPADWAEQSGIPDVIDVMREALIAQRQQRLNAGARKGKLHLRPF